MKTDYLIEFMLNNCYYYCYCLYYYWSATIA